MLVSVMTAAILRRQLLLWTSTAAAAVVAAGDSDNVAMLAVAGALAIPRETEIVFGFQSLLLVCQELAAWPAGATVWTKKNLISLQKGKV